MSTLGFSSGFFRLTFALLFVVLCACGIFSKSNSGDDDDDDGGGTVEVDTTEETPGVVTGKLYASPDKAQLLNASATGNIAGSSVTFPAGSLAVDMDFTVEEGVSIASAATATELGLDDMNRAGPAVVIDPASEVSVNGALAISVSLDDGSALVDETGTLTILYMIERSDGIYTGLVASITVAADGKTVIFNFTPNGAFLRLLFQAIRATGTVADTAPIKSEQEITTVREQSSGANTAPTIAALADVASKANVPVTASLDVGDGETDAASLVVTATSNNQLVFADTKLIVSGSGAVRTLTAQPENNVADTATITVTVSDGVAAASSDFQVTISGRTWTSPSSQTDNISPDGKDAGGIFDAPAKVAVSDNGDAVIVWKQLDSIEDTQIFLSERRNGTWTHPANVSTNISPNGYDAEMPDVAIDSDGNAIIAWHQNDGTAWRIFRSEYRSNSWTHPSDINDRLPSWNTEPSKYPSVAMNSTTAEISWMKGGSNFDMYHSSYSAGAWIDPDEASDKISPVDTSDDYKLHLSRMNENGDKLIVWNFNYKIFLSQFFDGSWTHPSGPTDYPSFDGGSLMSFDAALADNGDAVVVWQEWSNNNGGRECLFISEYRSGVWIHPANDLASFYVGPTSVMEVAVSMAANGDTIVAWVAGNKLYLSEYRAGSWTHPSSVSDAISPTTTGGPSDVTVVMSDHGNALVAWKQDESVDNRIYRSYYEGTWTHPADMSDYISPTGQASKPYAAMNAYGDAIIVWREFDGSYQQIFMSELK